jgi:hypothetical protein
VCVLLLPSIHTVFVWLLGDHKINIICEANCFIYNKLHNSKQRKSSVMSHLVLLKVRIIQVSFVVYFAYVS